MRQLVVFGLAEQIHGHPVRRRRAIGQHQNLTRAGNHVDPNLAENAPLGRSHVSIAWPGNLVHLGDRLRSESQRCNGLRATNRENLRDTSHVGSRQYQGVALTRRGSRPTGRSRCRYHHDNFRHARDMRRNGVHQHRGRIRGLAAGDIDADPIQRSDLLAQITAIGVTKAPALAAGLFLRHVVGPHALGCEQQRVALRLGNTLECIFQLLRAQLQLGHGRNVDTIKAPRVFEHGGITTLLHIVQDFRDARFDRRIGITRPVQTRLECRRKPGIHCGQSQWPGERLRHRKALVISAPRPPTHR